MTKITSERFVELVAKSELVDPAKCERLIAKVREKYDGDLPEDPKKLAALFRSNKLLTEWHIEKLLTGKYKGFFLGKYKLLGHLGTGGMSSVYLAQHIKMGDRRAIKVLPRRRVKDASYLARFQNEAKAIAALNHPNIVRAFDIDNEGDLHYLVMEYVDGDDLQVRVRKDGPFDFRTAAQVVIQAARGLQHAHDRGLIHRDIKPANLLIDSNGTIRLLDMGLALFSDNEEASLTIEHNENVLGTADYLAPEQALNSHDVDHRADIYGLGCTLYFMLTGQPPFPEGSLAQRIAKHQTEMPKSIRQIRTDCPGELEGMVVKMIQKDPRYRYQSGADVAEAFERWLATSNVPASSKRLVSDATGPPSALLLGSDSGSITVDSRVGDEDEHSKHDTVSNTGGDTMTGSGTSLSELSPSDSGRLVAVTPRKSRPQDSSGSTIDLERESGYEPRPLRSSQPRGVKLPPAKEIVSPSKIPGSKAARSASPQPVHPALQSKKQIPWLLIAVFAVMLLVALAVGFALAKLTS
ncbi:serine/threonine protein kinase [Roseimaritima sediminicola]|uniref:serine/threonine protein kinase n=1 Tax=Roseimaritima sediminicola TaxID=2662066 RepID=UPI0012983EFC|nr:serine/threonine-protein kinase [Roseimaritima sediminicola]